MGRMGRKTLGLSTGIRREWSKGTSQEEQITALKKQLAKHGGHTAECRVYNDNKPASIDPEVDVDDEYECIKECNWAKIAKGLP